MNKIIVLTRLILFLGVISFCDAFALDQSLVLDEDQEQPYIPDEGFVPDQATAAILAETILKPIYGVEKINNEKPFKVVLKDNVWIVTGTLPEGLMGGVAIIKISKTDAKVLMVSHGK